MPSATHARVPISCANSISASKCPMSVIPSSCKMPGAKRPAPRRTRLGVRPQRRPAQRPRPWLDHRPTGTTARRVSDDGKGIEPDGYCLASAQLAAEFVGGASAANDLPSSLLWQVPEGLGTVPTIQCSVSLLSGGLLTGRHTNRIRTANGQIRPHL